MKRFVRSMALVFAGSCLLMSCASLEPALPNAGAAGPEGLSTVPAGPEEPPAATPAAPPAERRDAVLMEAGLYIDKPYASPPHVPQNFDCSGFISYVFSKTTDLKLPTSSEAYLNAGVEISFDEAEPGDLLIFTSVPGGNKVDHVAVLYRKSATGELRGSLLIHAVSIPTQSATIKGDPDTAGVKITELGKRGDGIWQNEYFLSRYLSCRRVIH